jgi:hypothetical protein
MPSRSSSSVREGGTITLNGPPEDAVLDLTAVYEVETSVAELLDDNAITVSCGPPSSGYR